jgi:hypothetical protein
MACHVHNSGQHRYGHSESVLHAPQRSPWYLYDLVPPALHATGCMFKINKLPTTPLGGINPNVSHVVDRIQHLN